MFLVSYGTGAIMAVPAHDERDYEFAEKFDLPIVEVVAGGDVSKEAYVGDGPHINSGFLDGLGKDEAIEKAIAWFVEQGKGEKKVSYRLTRLVIFKTTLLGRADSDYSLGRWHDDGA